jgi:hypothetical protein
MAKKMLKFADGGFDRYKARMDRKTADIEKDYKIALAKGKNADVAKAKYEQRKADAADDYAKRTGADRSSTRAAESAAEAALKEARRTNGRSIQMRDTLEKNNKPLEIKSSTDSILKGLSAPSLTTTKKATAPVRKAAPKAVTPTRKTVATPPPPPPPVGSRTNPHPVDPKEDVVVTAKKGRDNSSAGSRKRFGEMVSSVNPFRAIARGIDSVLTAGTGPSKPAAKPKDTVNAAALAKNKLRVARLRAEGNERDAKFYEKYPTAMKKGGKVKKYAGGGSVAPQPTAAERAESRKQDERLKKAKVTTKEGKVIDSANRSEGTMKKAKGGSFRTSANGIAKKGKTKAMMPKMAGGGSCYAKGGSINGIAIRGKTRAPLRKGK